jgi:hypothetical protein
LIDEGIDKKCTFIHSLTDTGGHIALGHFENEHQLVDVELHIGINIAQPMNNFFYSEVGPVNLHSFLKVRIQLALAIFVVAPQILPVGR